jgi:hypothetical protein
MAEYDKSQPVMPDEPRDSEEKSQLIGTSSVNITFTQDVIGLEVANNSETATIYLKIDGSVATVSTGIPIYSKLYYSADKKILQSNGISIISDEVDTDVRVVGHYNLESENI